MNLIDKAIAAYWEETTVKKAVEEGREERCKRLALEALPDDVREYLRVKISDDFARYYLEIEKCDLVEVIFDYAKNGYVFRAACLVDHLNRRLQMRDDLYAAIGRAHIEWAERNEWEQLS